MRVISLTLAALAIVSATAGAQIVNGSFETGDFTGWTVMRSRAVVNFRSLPLPRATYTLPALSAGTTTYEGVFNASNNPSGFSYSAPISNGQFYATLSTFQLPDETDVNRMWTANAIRQTFTMPATAQTFRFEYIVDTVETMDIGDTQAEFDDYMFVLLQAPGTPVIPAINTTISKNDLIQQALFNGTPLYWLNATSRRTFSVDVSAFRNRSVTLTIGVVDEGDADNATDLYIDNVRVELAPAVTLSGVITLSELGVSPAGRVMRIRLFNPGNRATPVQDTNVTLGAQGQFSMTVNTPGTYDVMVTGGTFLTEVAPNQVLTSNRSLNLTMVNGDTDGNNAVDDGDLTNMILDFGGAPANGATDLNGDGVVDDGDLTVLILSFGQVGDN